MNCFDPLGGFVTGTQARERGWRAWQASRSGAQVMSLAVTALPAAPFYVQQGTALP